MTSLSEFLTTKEAAEKLGISRVRIQQLCKGNRLGRKIGDRYLIAMDELRQFAKLTRLPGRPRKS